MIIALFQNTGDYFLKSKFNARFLAFPEDPGRQIWTSCRAYDYLHFHPQISRKFVVDLKILSVLYNPLFMDTVEIP